MGQTVWHRKGGACFSPPEIRPLFSTDSTPCHSYQVAIIVFFYERKIYLNKFFGGTDCLLVIIHTVFIASALPNPGFFLQMKSTWAQKDQPFMAMPRQNIIKTKLLHSANCYCSLYWSEHSIIPLMGQSEGLFPWPTAKISRENQTSEMNSIELMISPLCLLPQFSSQQSEGFFPLFDWKGQKFATLSSLYILIYLHNGILPSAHRRNKWLFCWTAVQITWQGVCRSDKDQSDKHKKPRSFKNINCPQTPVNLGLTTQVISLSLTGPRLHRESMIKTHRTMEWYTC